MISASAALVKRRIAGIKVLGVQTILCKAEAFAESLKMHKFSLAEEHNRITYVIIIRKTEDIIVGRACFLFSRKILMQIGDHITF